MRGNKSSLADRVARKLGVGYLDAQDMVDAVLSGLVEEMMEKGAVLVTGFGTLSVVPVTERTARNPQTGEKVVVPARNKVRFTPGAALNRHVNGTPLMEGRSLLMKRPKGSAR